MRRCERCDWNITTLYILKQENQEEIICPNCGRVLVATSNSITMKKCFSYIIFFIFAILPLLIFKKIILLIIWILFSTYILPALIYNFEEKI